MRRAGIFIFLMAAAGAPASQAQSVDQTFVSAHGSDLNNCSFYSPCKSFSHALQVTASGGKIFALDAGDFGAVVINKSISLIANNSVPAIITAGVTGFGIDIQASANDKVSIQGIQIITGGVKVSSAASVEMARMVVRNSPEYGLIVNSPSRVVIIESLFSDNFNIGIRQVNPDSNLILRHVTVTGGGGNGGISTYGQAEIQDCTILNSQAGGLAVYETSSAFIKGTLISANRDGLQVLGKAIVDTTAVVGNGTGVFVSGSLVSYRNNNFVGNTQRDIYGPHPITYTNAQ